MRDLIQNIVSDFQQLLSSFNEAKHQTRIRELEEMSQKVGFWDDSQRASLAMQELSDLKDEIKEFKELAAKLDLIQAMEKAGEVGEEMRLELEKIQADVKRLKIKTFLSGEYDSGNALLNLNAGQGGTEAVDWTGMLYRMYLRYAEQKRWQTQTLDYSAGEEAGVKSVTFKIIGRYAYGYLKHESGTHRLVRQSPFNADNLRQTSFALVGVLPEITQDTKEIQIKEEELEWQFYHASSQGGQNVQKVSTAVRLKHLPTGIVVGSQTERFQEQNRKIALEMLRAKLWALQQEQHQKQVNAIKGEYRPASWGNQIRSYVLHPYKMVKDLRTGVESTNPGSVLDGQLDDFINAELKITL